MSRQVAVPLQRERLRVGRGRAEGLLLDMLILRHSLAFLVEGRSGTRTLGIIQSWVLSGFSGAGSGVAGRPEPRELCVSC